MTTARTGTPHPVAAYLADLSRPGLGGLTDGALLTRFAHDRDTSGETGAVESGQAAFAELVRRHGGSVRAACVRSLGDAHADADDCVQAVFLILARRAAEFAGTPSIAGFLHGVAVRVAWKARSRRHRRHRAEVLAARPEACPPHVPDDTAAAVDRAVQSLPAALRDVVVLCDLAGVSRRDAAARLGIAEGTLSSRRATAHARLARRLGPAVGLPAVVAATLSADAVAAVVKVAINPTGTAPAAVQSLVREALVAMLFTKLKPFAAAGFLLAAACGTGFGVAQVGGQPPANAPLGASTPPADVKPAEGAGRMLPPVLSWEADRKFLCNAWEAKSVKSNGADIALDRVGVIRRVYFDDRGRCGVVLNEERLGRVRPRVVADVPVRLSHFRTPREMTIALPDDDDVELWQMIYEPLSDKLLRIAYQSNWTAADRPTSFAHTFSPFAAPTLLVIEFDAMLKPGASSKNVRAYAERMGFPPAADGPDRVRLAPPRR